MSAKRVKRWPDEDRRWLDKLPENERELVLLLVAHLDAQPEDERAS